MGGSLLAYDFGQADVVGGPLNDLTVVGGDLVLDGTINVTLAPGGSLDPGLYRVISYAGTLTNNGLAIGTIPSPGFVVQTSIANQVNLVNTAGLTLSYWDGDAGPKNDGVINGGNGLWQSAAGNDNWTTATGTPNAPYADASFAIFAGAPGIVTVDDSLGAISTSGMQFATGGYLIEGDPINLVGDTAIVRVGDGSSAGAGITATIGSVLAGTSALAKTDLGTLVLTGTNSYSGGTAINGGVLQIASDANLGVAAGTLAFDGGTLRTTAGLTTARATTLNAGGGTFETAPATTLTHSGTIGGAGALAKTGSGTFILAGTNSYSGATNVAAGTLLVNGDQSAATGPTSVAGSAILGGTGTIGGNVAVANGGTLAPGVDVGTLTIAGNLSLAAGSTLDYQFGQANIAGGALNDLVNVGGDLILDGTINVTVPAGGAFDPGVYRMFNYGGDLTDNGLAIGTIPSPDTFVQTSVAGQVNLVNTAGLTLNYWDGDAGPKNDGVVNGGNGLWQSAAGNDNWTTAPGTPNAPFTDGAFAIFQGRPGTITVDTSLGAIDVAGMQFAVNGYVVGGDPLTLVGSGSSIVRVGDGTAAGTGMTATLHSALTGSSGLTKSDLGTLVLTGANTYAGGTAINGGILEIASDANLGAAAGGLGLQAGTLRTTADLATARATTLNAGGGTFETAPATTLTHAGTIGGAGALTKAGTGTLILTGTNLYSGGTTIAAGTLQLGNGGTTGSIAGNILDNGRLVANRSNQLVLGGVISGTGSFLQAGTGTTILTADNSYSGGTTIAAGTLQLGNGGATGSVAGNVVDNGTLVFDRANTLTMAGTISGSGRLVQAGSGTTILTANNLYAGPTDVLAGTLRVNGDQSLATGLTRVADGATLGGIGTIGGDVVIADGGVLAPGESPGTLTINGDLALSAGSILDYEFGQANVVGGPLNDLTIVGGDLALDGTINVTVSAGGAFDPGIYRVISYAGALTDNGLLIGTIPAGDYFVQTSIANQVNLVNTTGLTLNYWDGDAGPRNDGVVNGGNGLWQSAAGNDNWTTAAGTPNAPFTDASFAIFAATAGTVTVDDSLGAVNVSGMQFAANGYVVEGDPINLVGAPATIVRVGDGSAAGAGMTATIASALTGSSVLTKTDLGTLILTGTNDYSGGTAIDGGVLQIASDPNLGAAAGTLGLDGGTLRTTADIVTARTTTLNAGGGTFETAPGTTLTLGGAIGGAGALAKTGTGTLLLLADNLYAGGTTISAGTLQLGNGGTTGSIQGDIANNGALVVNRSNQIILDGNISGTGSLTQAGTGTTVLTGTNSYAGGTTIAAGTLQIGNGGTTGSLTGDVVDNGILVFDRSDTLTFAGLVSGSGRLVQAGSGTLILAGANSYAGPTDVRAGTLLVNGNQGAATGLVSVAGGATLGGTGIIGGDVVLADGSTLAPGVEVGTLTINGDLTLGAGAILAYQFGAANVVGGALNDLTVVGGDLVLDGTINVAVPAGGAFDAGIYRIFDYGGALTNNGLALGAIPSTSVFVQTSVPGQVNLVNTAGLTLNLWDGTGPKNDGVVNGGSGVWQSGSGNDNWTTVAGTPNAPFNDGAFAIFQGSPGTVTVDQSLGPITVSGLQFAVDGYVVQGDPINLVGAGSTIVRVGDGTSAGAGMTATIGSVLAGSSGLTKTDLGTLVLTGSNLYSGGTQINAGTLQVGSDANLGAPAGGLAFVGGTLRTTTDIRTPRAVALNAGGGTFETASGTAVTLDGIVSGPGALAKTGAGALILLADNFYTGPTRVLAGTLGIGDPAHPAATITSDATVAPNAVLGGYGTVDGDVGNAGTIAVADALDRFSGGGSGSFTVTGTLANAGLADLGGAGVGNRLVVGSYAGQNGTIALNTSLGGDGSPTDQLVIQGGTATGSSSLRITDVGGGGAATPGNGIEVVVAAAGATTAPGAFTLSDRVVAGPYQYNLFRGGRDGTAPAESWFLRPELEGGPPPGPGPGPEPPPDFRDEVPTYTALPSMALMFGRNLVGTLHDRVGDQALLLGRFEGSRTPGGAWGRMLGQRNEWEAAPGGIYNEGPSFRASYYAMQIGVDLLRRAPAGGGLTVAGLYGSFGWSEGIVRDFDRRRAGRVKFDAYTVGAYATHYGAGGWYADAVVQATRYEARAGSGFFEDMRTEGTGLVASLEVGLPIALGGGFRLEPQAQIIYQGIDFDDSFDDAAEIRFDDVESLTGRLGLRLVHQGERQTSRGALPYAAWLRANLWREFMAEPRTSFSSADGFVPFRSDIRSTWAEFGVGASVEVTRGATLFASGAYQTAFGQEMSAWDVRAGLRFNW